MVQFHGFTTKPFRLLPFCLPIIVQLRNRSIIQMNAKNQNFTISNNKQTFPRWRGQICRDAQKKRKMPNQIWGWTMLKNTKKTKKNTRIASLLEGVK